MKKMILDLTTVGQMLDGLNAVLGFETRCTLSLAVPMDVYLEILGTTTEGNESLSYNVTLEVVPDPDLVGAGAILTVTSSGEYGST